MERATASATARQRAAGRCGYGIWTTACAECGAVVRFFGQVGLDPDLSDLPCPRCQAVGLWT